MKTAYTVCANQQTYKNDPFTSRNGHYVGHDGFLVPKDFEEFYQRFPGYVVRWVSKHADRFATKQNVEDWTDDLLVHMMRLPESSKFRQIGKTDRVQTFDPVKQHGANAARFWNYVNICLMNKFRTMRSERIKDALCRPGNLSLNAGAEKEDYGSVGDEYCHSHSAHLQTAMAAADKHTRDGMFLQEFVNFVRREDPDVLPAIHAILATGMLSKAADWLGISRGEIVRTHRRLRQLARCFQNGETLSKQRKRYKKRTAQKKEFTCRRLAA